MFKFHVFAEKMVELHNFGVKDADKVDYAALKVSREKISGFV